MTSIALFGPLNISSFFKKSHHDVIVFYILCLFLDLRLSFDHWKESSSHVFWLWFHLYHC